MGTGISVGGIGVSVSPNGVTEGRLVSGVLVGVGVNSAGMVGKGVCTTAQGGT